MFEITGAAGNFKILSDRSGKKIKHSMIYLQGLVYTRVSWYGATSVRRMMEELEFRTPLITAKDARCLNICEMLYTYVKASIEVRGSIESVLTFIHESAESVNLMLLCDHPKKTDIAVANYLGITKCRIDSAGIHFLIKYTDGHYVTHAIVRDHDAEDDQYSPSPAEWLNEFLVNEIHELIKSGHGTNATNKYSDNKFAMDLGL